MRTAVIDLDPEVLGQDFGPLIDAGLRVHCSLDTSAEAYASLVRLVVSGECLPPECERGPGDPVRRVRPWLHMEAYGRQRLIKVDRFDLDPEFRFHPPVLESA